MLPPIAKTVQDWTTFSISPTGFWKVEHAGRKAVAMGKPVLVNDNMLKGLELKVGRLSW